MENTDPIYLKVKPYYRSVTIFLGILVAVAPAALEFWQKGQFDTASIVSFALGIVVIINRLLQTPAKLTAPDFVYRLLNVRK